MKSSEVHLTWETKGGKVTVIYCIRAMCPAHHYVFH